MNGITKFVGLTVMTALASGPAQAACWTPAAYQAAQVRELDMMFAAGAKRCQQGPSTFAAAYDGFVQANGAALKTAGDTLRRHFAVQFGEAEAAGAHRDFVAAGTERHGAGRIVLTCEELAAVAKAAAAAGPDRVARFAQSAGLRPKAEDRLCREVQPSLLVAARR